MATKNLVPRGDGEGGIGNSSRSWGEGHFKNLQCERSFSMPTTTTADRPTSPVVGTTVFDTEVGGLVIWNGSIWVEAGVPSPKTLALSVDPVGAGSVFGAGTYDKGADVSISATANTNYAFSQWEGDISNVRDANQNPTLVTMSSSWVITAKFSVAQYDLTVDSVAGGTVTGTGSYDYGSTIQIEAIPDTANGYEFTGWTGDGIDDPSSPTTTVLIDGNKTVTANFAFSTHELIINTVTDPDLDGIYEIDTSGAVGTTTGADTSIDYGSIVNITATIIDNSYEFKGWEGSGVADPTSPTTTVTLTSDLILNAKFAKKTYTADITVANFDYQGNPEVPGTATIDNSTPIHGSSVAITATSSDPKYEFDYWDGASSSLLTDINNSSATINPIEADVVLIANFKLIQFTFTATISGEGSGSFIGLDEDPDNIGTFIGSFDYGSTPSVEIVPDQGSAIHPDAWTPTSLLAGYNERFEAAPSFLPILSDITADVKLNLLSYDILVTADNLSYTETSAAGANWSAGAGGYNIVTFNPFGLGGTHSGYSPQNPSSYKAKYKHGTVVTITPNINSSYRFLRWTDVPGVDAESPSINYTVTGPAELTFEVAKPPVSTFLTKGDLYFGETIELIDISTAPSGDGTVVSAEYTNDSGIAFNSKGNFLRTFQGVQEHGQIEVSNPGNIMDLSKTWCVMMDFVGSPIHYPVNYHFVGLNRGETVLGGLGPSFHSGTNFQFHPRWFQDEAVVLNVNYNSSYSNRIIYYCDGSTLYQAILSSNGSLSRQSTSTASWDALNGSDTSKLYIGSGKNTSNMVASSGQITNQGFNIAANWNSVLFYDGSLPTDADMLEFLASEDGTDPATYSFYGNLYDAIKCATKTYPSLDGEKGNIQAEFIEGSEVQFKSFATLDLPSGSPGDTTGSVDVTLTVTDDQGLTGTATQTITYGLPALNEDSDISLSATIVNDGGLDVLSAPIILGAEIDTTLNNGVVITKNK